MDIVETIYIWAWDFVSVVWAVQYKLYFRFYLEFFYHFEL